MMDIFEVGTGGGSIARVDGRRACASARRARARSRARPATAAAATEPTVTDANLVLGRLGADRFLGGEMKLDVDGRRARDARTIAKPLGMSVDAKPPTASCASPRPRCPTR